MWYKVSLTSHYPSLCQDNETYEKGQNGPFEITVYDFPDEYGSQVCGIKSVLHHIILHCAKIMKLMRRADMGQGRKMLKLKIVFYYFEVTRLANFSLEICT